MEPTRKIRNSKELEFAVFCIENIAQKLNVNAERVYTALTEKSDILNDYIIPEYDILHTQSKEYIRFVNRSMLIKSDFVALLLIFHKYRTDIALLNLYRPQVDMESSKYNTRLFWQTGWTRLAACVWSLLIGDWGRLIKPNKNCFHLLSQKNPSAYPSKMQNSVI